MQISANGKTTSLGDHDTEEQAARAFDRATINKNGTVAKTNFSLEDYKDEIADLRGNRFLICLKMIRKSNFMHTVNQSLLCSPSYEKDC